MLRKARKSVLKTWVGRVVRWRRDKNKQWEVYMQYLSSRKSDLQPDMEAIKI